MPNGGSDCCGTCWFNRRNGGQSGHVRGDPSIAPHCEIRDFPIGAAFYTYCANHPKRRPSRDRVPIGPVSVDDGRGREIVRASPDTPAVRAHLLALLAGIVENPPQGYPIGPSLDHVIVWQLGEFVERGAIPDLERILRFAESEPGRDPFHASRKNILREAREALTKIRTRRPPAPPITLEDRVFGVLFGQAVGDALGLGTEFMSREDVAWHYPEGLGRYEQIIQDAHRRRWKPGDWTDDTEQMTMILDSLLETGRADVRDIGRRIYNWVVHARGEGGGMTVEAVLKHPRFAEDPHAAAQAVWEKSGRRIAANGGVMRTSVLGLWDFDDPARIRANAEAACKVTHFDPRCVGSCVAVSLLVNALVHGRLADETLLKEIRNAIAGYDARLDEAFALAEHADPSALELDEDEAIGYTLKPLAAGLWALRHASSFEDGLLRVVAQGGDADSNAAVVGALLGARDGLRAIPTRLVRGLTRAAYLSRVAKALLSRISPVDGAAASGASLLELEVGGVITDGSVVEYARRALGQRRGPWVLFARGTWVELTGAEGGSLAARAIERLRAPTEARVEVYALRHTEGWVASVPGTGVATFIHPLEMKSSPSRDQDIAEFATFKRARDAEQSRVIHVSAGVGA